MNTRLSRVWPIVGTIALVALNAAFIAFFRFWQVADTTSINNMEDTVGFDPSFMLPNAELMWIAAHACLLLLIFIDICAVAMWVGRTKQTQVTALVPEAATEPTTSVPQSASCRQVNPA